MAACTDVMPSHISISNSAIQDNLLTYSLDTAQFSVLNLHR